MESTLDITKWRIPLLILSTILLVCGTCTGPLFTRLYFLHGGESRWLASGLQTSAWPLILVPLMINYLNRRRHDNGSGTFSLNRRCDDNDSGTFFLMDPFLYKSSALAGVLFGIVNLFYGYGSSNLPVSTSSLIFSSQLGFTVLFAYFLVSQRLHKYTVITIVSLTLGGVVLGLQSRSDASEGEDLEQYGLGFVMMILAALLNAFVLPFMELTYRKAEQEINYGLVMEFNMMMGVFATGFCGLGWFISMDFKGIVQEAKAFDLGEGNYYIVLVLIAISWQCTLLGINGVIFCSSSLLSGILLTFTVPITQVLGVFFCHEKFNVAKGIALVFSIFGFISYFYGEVRYMKKARRSSQLGSPLMSPQHDVVVPILS